MHILHKHETQKSPDFVGIDYCNPGPPVVYLIMSGGPEQTPRAWQGQIIGCGLVIHMENIGNKKFPSFRKKPLDKPAGICYNKYGKQEKGSVKK